MTCGQQVPKLLTTNVGNRAVLSLQATSFINDLHPVLRFFEHNQSKILLGTCAGDWFQSAKVTAVERSMGKKGAICCTTEVPPSVLVCYLPYYLLRRGNGNGCVSRCSAWWLTIELEAGWRSVWVHNSHPHRRLP